MARKYDSADFNIQPFKVANAVEEMRAMDLLKWGSIITVEQMYALVEVPYLSPQHVGKRGRFDKLKTTYTNRRKILRNHLLQFEAKALEWVDKEQAYIMIAPDKLVSLKGSRFRRTVSGNAVNVTDTLKIMRNYMSAPVAKDADKLMREVDEIEQLLRK